MNFKTHPVNIEHIKAAVNAFGQIAFHGDGNIYKKNPDFKDNPWYDSDFRANFSNPLAGDGMNASPSTYRIFFKKGDKIPETVKDLNDALLKAKMEELKKQDDKIVTNSPVNTIPGTSAKAAEKKEEPAK